MAKYALMNGNKVDTVSYVPQEGFVEVADTVFADMIKDGAGNFDYSAERKAEAQAVIDAATQKATDKTTGNQKLLDLGLTQAEVDALTGH